MHFHPALDSASLEKIGVWEDDGEIVAVAHCEWGLGEAFFQFHPAYRRLRGEMLDYAEANLAGVSRQDGRRCLRAYVNDNDPDFLSLVQARGYAKDPDGTRPLYRFDIPDPFPAIPLAEGFRLTSLAEECDWGKVHRALWRGFNHEGEPPMSDEELGEPPPDVRHPHGAARPEDRGGGPQRGVRRLLRHVLRADQPLRLRRAGRHRPGLPPPGAWARPPCWRGSAAAPASARPWPTSARIRRFIGPSGSGRSITASAGSNAFRLNSQQKISHLADAQRSQSVVS